MHCFKFCWADNTIRNPNGAAASMRVSGTFDPGSIPGWDVFLFILFEIVPNK